MLRTPLLAILALGAPLLSAQVPRIDPKPSLVISATAADGKMTIGTINAADLLPDGGVVIADGSANQLLYFGGDGALMHRAGGNGEGPGEFRRLWGVLVCGGSVFGYEQIAPVLQRFDLSGILLSMIRLQRPFFGFTKVACAGRKSLAGMSDFKLTSPPVAGPPVAGTPVDVQASVTVIDLTGKELFAVSVPRAAEMVMARGGGMPRPLGILLTIASLGDSVVFGTGESATIMVASGAGHAESRLLPLKTAAPTTADRQAAEAPLLGMVPPDFRPVAAAGLAKVPLPDSLPYYRKMLASPDGTIWMLTSAPSATRATWTITDGRPAARRRHPAGGRRSPGDWQGPGADPAHRCRWRAAVGGVSGGALMADGSWLMADG